MSGGPAPPSVRPGAHAPAGAQADDRGVNFSVLAPNATEVELVLYEQPDSPQPSQTISLDPEIHRSYGHWHVYVEGVAPGTCYTWRVRGPTGTASNGFHFRPGSEMLDPRAREVATGLWDRSHVVSRGRSDHHSMRAVVVRDDDYDWEGDRPLRRPPGEAVVYELHVAGFTRHPSSDVRHPGTFVGLAEKIPYLRELGVTDVELLPVAAFDPQDVPEGTAARGLVNFWGYSPHSFFALHPAYGSSPEAVRREFRDLVKALHRADIGVVLDVVLNHTAEGGAHGPVINLKGLGNEFYYQLDPSDRRRYRDVTGCGNTVNCNHPLVSWLLLDCIEYWVSEYHVDGFRFDMASVLTRGEDGEPERHALLPWALESSPVLAHTRLIAEAWDAGGLYQVGSFPGLRWAEWNGRYRDSVRRFVRGDRGLVGEVAARISGSSDLYRAGGRLPESSVNFITCHDGFTVHDLVSYARKHNEANGEDNRDGNDTNWSSNHGVEGETDDPEILDVRRRQAKNLLAILLVSRGVPMLLAGDEFLRTQHGNNNAWCHDNELGWIDWSLAETNADMLRFVREMIALRKRHPSITSKHFLTGEPAASSALPDVQWHGHRLGEPPWDDPGAQLLAYTLAASAPGEAHLHVVLNMSEESLELPLPELPGLAWFRAVDTGLAPPRDVWSLETQERVAGRQRVHPHSVVVFESR